MNSTRILGRGVTLVAVFDLIIAIIGICATMSQLVDSIWLPNSYLNLRESTGFYYVVRATVIFILGVYVFILIFGIFLLMGVRNGRPSFLTAWFVPNVIWVSAALVFAFAMAFTRFGLTAMFLPGAVMFRGFEIWIVYEFHADMMENK